MLYFGKNQNQGILTCHVRQPSNGSAYVFPLNLKLSGVEMVASGVFSGSVTSSCCCGSGSCTNGSGGGGGGGGGGGEVEGGGGEVEGGGGTSGSGSGASSTMRSSELQGGGSRGGSTGASSNGPRKSSRVVGSSIDIAEASEGEGEGDGGSGGSGGGDRRRWGSSWGCGDQCIVIVSPGLRTFSQISLKIT